MTRPHTQNKTGAAARDPFGIPRAAAPLVWAWVRFLRKDMGYLLDYIAKTASATVSRPAR